MLFSPNSIMVLCLDPLRKSQGSATPGLCKTSVERRQVDQALGESFLELVVKEPSDVARFAKEARNSTICS